MTEQIKITAMLSTIRFHSMENSFLIGIFSTPSNGEIACLGSMLNPQVGLSYTLWGSTSTHETFGKQFQFSHYEVEQPKDTAGLHIYLVRYARHVGPTIAGRLIDKYGVDVLDKIKGEPDKVAKAIKGLTKKKVETIREALLENEEIEAALVELTRVLSLPNMRKSLPIDLIDKYGSNAVEKLRLNPYILCNFAGTGFLMADQFALGQGFPPDSIFRQRAALEYVMDQDLQRGNTWIACGQLQEIVAMDLIGIAATDGLKKMEDEERVVIRMKNGMRFCCLAEVDIDESLIAEKLSTTHR